MQIHPPMGRCWGAGADTGLRVLGMDQGTICFPAGGRGHPGMAHLPSLLGQKWNSLLVEEAVEVS